MKIKRYDMKQGTTLDDILYCGGKEGGEWIKNGSKYFISKGFCNEETNLEISIEIAFMENITDWDDFENVVVIDEDFCQPYTPFYQQYGLNVTYFPALEFCVKQYNDFMDSLPFLIEKKV